MDDTASIGPVLDPTRMARVDAVYSAAELVTGIEFRYKLDVPGDNRHPGRNLTRMVRAVAVTAALAEGDGLKGTASVRRFAASVGMSRRAVCETMRDMAGLLQGRPHEAQIILAILVHLSETGLVVELPEKWREAINYAW